MSNAANDRAGVPNAAKAAFFVTLIAMLGSWLPPAPAETPVPPSPATTLAAFIKALEEADVAALATLVSGDAKERAWVQAEANQLRAFRDLEQALAKRYGKLYTEGEAGKELREQIETAQDEDLHTDLKHAKLGKLGGDTVLVILDEAGPDDRQGQLVLSDGRWTMELSSLSNYFSVDDTPGLRTMANAAAALARDIAAGKFATLDEAAMATEERLTAAEEAPAKKTPATPATKGKQPQEKTSRFPPEQ